MSSYAGPEVASNHTLIPEQWPDMESRVEIKGQVCPSNNPAYQGDIITRVNRNAGVLGYVHLKEPGERAKAIRLAKLAKEQVSSDLITQDMYPGLRLGELLKEVNHRAGEAGVSAMLSFSRTWEESDGNRYAAIACIGSGQVYLNRAQDGQGYAEAEPLFIPDESAALDGSAEALGKIQTRVILLGPGDRLTTASPAAQNNQIEGELTAGKVDQAVQIHDLDEAAIFLNGTTPGERDRVVAIQRNLPPSVGSPDQHEAAPLPPLASAYGYQGSYPRVVPRPFSDQYPPTSSAPTAQGPRTRGSSRWQRRKGGRAAALTMVPTLTSYQAFKDERQRRRIADAQAGRFTKWDRVKAQPLLWMATLGSMATLGAANYHIKMNRRQRFARIADDYERHQAIERRRQRKGAIIGGIIIGIGIMSPFLKRWGMDVVPSHLRINLAPFPGHVTIGDGDGIDLTPWHGTSHYHATSPWDKRDGGFPQALFGYLFDDDPAFPRSKPHTGTGAGVVISPPGRHVPPYTPPGNNVPPPAGGANSPGKAPASALETYQISKGSLYTDTLEGVIHQIGHRQVGFAHFTGGGAHRVMVELRREFGNNIATINGAPGTEVAPNGDLWLARLGQMQWASSTIQQRVHELIAANAV